MAINSDNVTIDLTDSVLFADGPPFETFARMRESAPVHWNAVGADDGFWSLTTFEDIVPVNKDWQRFSSARRGSFLAEGGILPTELASMLFNMMDPPEHERQRGILQKVFTAKAVEDRADDVVATISRLIDGIIEAGECDFVADLAVELPLTVTANMLGVPHEDRDKLFHWTNQMADTEVSREDKLAMMGELGGYLQELIAERRGRPTEDLLSRLIHAEVDGERLTDVEVIVHFAQLMAGGNETTRNAFAGGMLALIAHPDQRQKLLDDPSLIPAAVEEILRWHTPILHQARTATEDLTIRDQQIREGEKVVMWYASANRDEAQNERPDEFDVSRAKPKHLSFGAGRHFCLGNQLARLEIAIALRETLRRLPDLELAGPVEKKASNSFHWMVAMPVAFPPAATQTPAA
jgi:cytochrome P450